jgi:hypothetical protein
MTLSIKVTQHNNVLLLCQTSLYLAWHFIYCYAECHYAEYDISFNVILNGTMLNITFIKLLCWMSLCWVEISFTVMLNVIMLSMTFHLLLCWMSLCWVWHFFYCYAECHYDECPYDECIVANKTVPHLLAEKHKADTTIYLHNRDHAIRPTVTSMLRYDLSTKCLSAILFSTKWCGTD